MRKTGALVQKILIAILTAVLLLNLYLFAVQVAFRDELPKLMDVYEAGDVVTYRSGGSLVTHRVVEIDGTDLITQGDANNVADEPVALSQVEGKMIFRIPKLGQAALLLRKPAGILVTVLAGLLLIIVPTLADWRRKPKQD
jgi:signal peptidase I